MSGIGTITTQNATEGSTGDIATTRARLKHIGTSILPLALFVGSTLGYEQLTQRRSPLHPPAAPATVSAKPAAGPSDSSPVTHPVHAIAPSARPIAAKQQPQQQVAALQNRAASSPISETVAATSAPTVRTAPDAAITLRDERGLLELSRLEAGRTTPSAPAQTQPQAPAATHIAPLAEPLAITRSLDTVVDSTAPVLLGFKSDRDPSLGVYAIVRGVPQSARLSHGIAVGDESWLIDGIDIASTAIDLRGAAAGKVVLELAILSANSTLLQRENVSIDVKQAPVAATAPKALAPVANAPVAPSLPTVQVRISRETNLIPGRGGLLNVDIEPKSAIPRGAYVVVRGLPADTVMSRGMAMGPEAWLLTLSELAELEVRLPAKASGAIKLATKLVTVDGNLIAEDQYDVAVRTPAVAAAPKAQPVAAQPPATRSPGITPPAPVVAVRPPPAPASAPPAPTPPKAVAAAAAQIVTRSIAPPTPPTANPAAAGPGQQALARGRRMLDIGNIAAARPMLERSAIEGSGDAAALLAASFDPDWLWKNGAFGVTADPAKASYWYDEARKLGVENVERITGASKGR